MRADVGFRKTIVRSNIFHAYHNNVKWSRSDSSKCLTQTSLVNQYADGMSFKHITEDCGLEYMNVYSGAPHWSRFECLDYVALIKP